MSTTWLKPSCSQYSATEKDAPNNTHICASGPVNVLCILICAQQHNEWQAGASLLLLCTCEKKPKARIYANRVAKVKKSFAMNIGFYCKGKMPACSVVLGVQSAVKSEQWHRSPQTSASLYSRHVQEAYGSGISAETSCTLYITTLESVDKKRGLQTKQPHRP